MIKLEYTLEKAEEVRASMLSEQTYTDAHAQEALTDAWANCSIAWAVAASIHERYASKKDPFYITRQQDLDRNADAARKKSGHKDVYNQF
jgi:hypothetical protein